MSVLATDYLSLNRGGTPGDGGSGTYYVAPVSELTALLVHDLVPAIISSDANNALAAGSDDKLFIRNSALASDVANGQLTFTDNMGATNSVPVTGWMASSVAP